MRLCSLPCRDFVTSFEGLEFYPLGGDPKAGSLHLPSIAIERCQLLPTCFTVPRQLQQTCFNVPPSLGAPAGAEAAMYVGAAPLL